MPDHPVFLITIYKRLMKTGKLMLWLEAVGNTGCFRVRFRFVQYHFRYSNIGIVFEQIEVKWGDNNNYIKEN